MSTAPPLPAGFTYRPDLRDQVTPKFLKDFPIHRWFWFPHSFSPRLLDAVLEKYPISRDKQILDPFMGAGTTLVRASQLGYSSAGVDLSPLSILVAQAKLSKYHIQHLERDADFVMTYVPLPSPPSLPPRLTRAFSPNELVHLLAIRNRILSLSSPSREFFLVALLRLQKELSRAVANGGWIRWVEKEDQSILIPRKFAHIVNEQIHDLHHAPPLKGPTKVQLMDAREIYELSCCFDRVLTSPPYPNRHDYSRVFHIELLTLGLSEEEIRVFRYRSLRSHVEARPPSASPRDYIPPDLLVKTLQKLPSDCDGRVVRMLTGYFEDLYAVLFSLFQVLSPGGICAFVIGNVRHCGVLIPVDEILVELGLMVGFAFEEAWVARLRGNSAQQMGKFGKIPSRESVVFLKKPSEEP